MTANKVKLRLEKYAKSNSDPNLSEAVKEALTLLNYYQDRVKIQNRKISQLEAETEELAYKLGCLLCHATGGKLSKHTYPIEIMESYVNDTIQEYCEEAQAEARKEFADLSIKRICEQVSAPTPSESYIVERCNQVIYNLLKEMGVE